MTKEEGRDVLKKESKSLWGARAFVLIFLVIVILIIIVVVQRVNFRARRIGCAIQLKCLQSALWVYMNDFQNTLPTANAWNDLLINHADVVESIFLCPGSESSGKTSDYAINVNLYGKEVSKDTVLLFECNPGWNQVGGPEIFNPRNHKNTGGYNTINIPEGRFVTSDEVEHLSWEP